MLVLRAFAVLQAGKNGLFESYIDRALEMTSYFAAKLKEFDDFAILTDPESNIICYRYTPANVSEEILNSLNSKIRQSIVDSGDFYIVQVEKNGRTWLRSALMNPFIDHSVIDSLIGRIRSEGMALLEETRSC